MSLARAVLPGSAVRPGCAVRAGLGSQKDTHGGSAAVRRSLALAALALLGGCDGFASAGRAAPGASSSAVPVGAPVSEAPSASSVQLTTAPVSLGEAAQAPSYRLTAHRVQPCASAAWRDVKAGHLRLGVELEVMAASEGAGQVPVNAFYAQLVNSEGKAHRAVFGGCEPDLRHKPLAPGESARGFVTFEVPESPGRLTLRYEPQLASGARERLEVDLGAAPLVPEAP